MYELFDAAEQAGQPFLIQIARNRKTVENQKIIDAIKEKACMGKIAVTIPRDSRKGLTERGAVLQMRYERFAIQRPQIRDTNKLTGQSRTHGDICTGRNGKGTTGTLGMVFTNE